MKRVFQYDLMRVICMLMVLGVHVLSKVSYFVEPYNTSWYIKTILTNIFMICNPLFFMLSGKFNLKKEICNKQEYKNYYVKKIITILFPALIISAFVYFISFANYSFIDFFQKIVSGEIQGTYWFIYTLIAILVFSPFYSKFLLRLSLFEKKLFLIISFLTNAFVTILLSLNIPNALSLSAFGIVSWHFYYFSGYFIDDVFEKEKHQKIVIFLGFVAFIIQFCIQRFANGGNYRLYNPGPILTIEAYSLYFILLKVLKIKHQIICRAISFVAKYSFLFYLLHMTIVKKISELFIFNISSLQNMLYAIIIYIFSFFITILLSILFEKIIISPLQKEIMKFCL